MDEIRIRPATSIDIPHVVNHRRQMFAEMRRGTAADREKMCLTTTAYLRDSMPAGRYRAWLAETAEGHVVGGVGIAIVDWPGSPDDPAPRRAWVLNVYTEPDFRRLGVARRLMETLLEWSSSNGLGSVALHASDYGRALYEKLGFRPTNEMRLRFR